MNRYYGILEEKPTEGIKRWLATWVPPDIDRNQIYQVATRTSKYIRASKQGRKSLRINQELEQRWYAALREGRFDWDVYDSDLYLADLWVCWAIYSREALRAIRSSKALWGKSVPEDLGKVRRVVDLGCGFGYTTIALQDMFREAEVIGTNLKDTKQWDMLSKVAATCGFTITPDIHTIQAPVDLVFASEYFEHFLEPVAHLKDVLSTLHPRALVVANSFGSQSIGHFPQYVIGGEKCDPKATAKAFSQALRDHGYSQVKMNVWNNRPNYWKRD